MFENAHRADLEVDCHKAAHVDRQSESPTSGATTSLRDSSSKSEHRPGDIFLDRYLTNASPETREEARENLRRLVDLVIRVEERLAREKVDNSIRAPGDSALDSESLPIHL